MKCIGRSVSLVVFIGLAVAQLGMAESFDWDIGIALPR